MHTAKARSKVDLSLITKEIVSKDMRRSEQIAYTDALWNDESGMLRVYYGLKHFFLRQLEIEIDKLTGQFPHANETINTIGEEINLEDLPLYKWKQENPEKYNKMKALIFNRAMRNGKYICARCGKSSPHKGLFQIDHIFPMSKGGKTTEDNLQLLCRSCNMKKGDKA